MGKLVYESDCSFTLWTIGWWSSDLHRPHMRGCGVYFSWATYPASYISAAAMPSYMTCCLGMNSNSARPSPHPHEKVLSARTFSFHLLFSWQCCRVPWDTHKETSSDFTQSCCDYFLGVYTAVYHILTKNLVNHKSIWTVGIFEKVRFWPILAECVKICSEDHWITSYFFFL